MFLQHALLLLKYNDNQVISDSLTRLVRINLLGCTAVHRNPEGMISHL